MRTYKQIELIFIVSVLLFVCCSITAAGFNLPQKQFRVEIAGDNHLQFKKYFAPKWELPEEFDTTIANLLIQSLPKAFDKGSKEMISHWGKSALRAASKAVRVLLIKNFNPAHQQILLTYTWYSAAPGFGDQYYDERLALLTILDTSSRLLIYPPANPCEKCADLTHIGMGDELRIGGQSAVSIFFNTSNKNPCCDTSRVKEEVYMKYYILNQSEMKECLTLLQQRTERFHIFKGNDSTAVYTATISYNKDQSENITSVFSESNVASNDEILKTEIHSYSWDKKRQLFLQNNR